MNKQKIEQLAHENGWDILQMNEGQEAQGMMSFTKNHDAFGDVRLNYWRNSGTIAIVMAFPVMEKGKENWKRDQRFLRDHGGYLSNIMKEPSIFIDLEDHARRVRGE